jgi:hypothetical protein
VYCRVLTVFHRTDRLHRMQCVSCRFAHGLRKATALTVFLTSSTRMHLHRHASAVLVVSIKVQRMHLRVRYVKQATTKAWKGSHSACRVRQARSPTLYVCTCTMCAAGGYSSDPGVTSCIVCAVGPVTNTGNEQGASSCTECAAAAGYAHFWELLR